MSTKIHSKTEVNNSLPNLTNARVCILVAEWNKNVTTKLLEGARKALKASGCKKSDIVVEWVAGALELPYAAKVVAQTMDYDGIVALGCVLRGDTPHFDYVCRGTFDGLMRIQLDEDTPIGFGILTTDTLEQAMDRAGGSLGNKGYEAAIAMARMIQLRDKYDFEDDDDSFDLPDFDDEDFNNEDFDDNLLN